MWFFCRGINNFDFNGKETYTPTHSGNTIFHYSGRGSIVKCLINLLLSNPFSHTHFSMSTPHWNSSEPKRFEIWLHFYVYIFVYIIDNRLERWGGTERQVYRVLERQKQDEREEGVRESDLTDQDNRYYPSSWAATIKYSIKPTKNPCLQWLFMEPGAHNGTGYYTLA